MFKLPHEIIKFLNDLPKSIKYDTQSKPLIFMGQIPNIEDFDSFIVDLEEQITFAHSSSRSIGNLLITITTLDLDYMDPEFYFNRAWQEMSDAKQANPEFSLPDKNVFMSRKIDTINAAKEWKMLRQTELTDEKIHNYIHSVGLLSQGKELTNS
ncbi:hypothetical protein [Enterobacter hormaechei]|uniref:hypothetical protein n=1 Tax=Enterobacter hormaechei TaxID=158836 RepID=UPI002A74D36B|nr:hypothetical protein [Enterobacter hormaechei]MDY3572331.1 hypothetical protein [Enterobacter hormaechei]